MSAGAVLGRLDRGYAELRHNGVLGSLAEKLVSLTAIVVLLLYALGQRGDPKKVERLRSPPRTWALGRDGQSQ